MDDYALPPFGPSLFHVSGKAGCRYRKKEKRMTEIVHNVADRRNDWIGPWEIESEPLDISKLWAGDEGRTVIYRDYGRAEAGTLSSWTATTVFVRFHKGDTAAGCSAGDLHFAIRDASPDFYFPPASADTHRDGGDALAAPFMGGAVAANSSETPNLSAEGDS